MFQTTQGQLLGKITKITSRLYWKIVVKYTRFKVGTLKRTENKFSCQNFIEKIMKHSLDLLVGPIGILLAWVCLSPDPLLILAGITQSY